KIRVGIGFSTQIFLQSAFINFIKNSFALMPFLYLSSCKTPPLYKCLAPALEIYVQGGCAIIISHLPDISCNVPSCVINFVFPFKIGNTSPRICHSVCPPLHSCISQEYASCPFSRKAIHTL